MLNLRFAESSKIYIVENISSFESFKRVFQDHRLRDSSVRMKVKKLFWQSISRKHPQDMDMQYSCHASKVLKLLLGFE